MTIREAANNTSTGGISAAASSGGGSAGLTEAQVTTLANTAVADKSEYFFLRSYEFSTAQAYIGEDSLDVDTYPRLKFRIFNIMPNSGSDYYILPSSDGSPSSTTIPHTGHAYRNSTPFSWNSSSYPRPANGSSTYSTGVNSQSMYVFEFNFTRSTDNLQNINVTYDCGIQDTGGYQSYAHSGQMMIDCGGTHYNGVRLVPTSGQFVGSYGSSNKCRVEVYQGKYITPTAL